MSIPVTTRLDETTVDALDRAIAAGQGTNRGAIISEAVRDWMARHDEEAIVASYLHRYGAGEPEHDDLVAGLGLFSASSCLARNQD